MVFSRKYTLIMPVFVSNFPYPLYSDYLAWKYQDYFLAVVYAKIERFCSLGNDRICDACIETFMQELVAKEGKINSRIDLLVKEEYVIDSTPDLVNRSHNRTVTEKLQKEEDDFHAWAESYRKEEVEKRNKLPSYYDSFVVYANQNNIESFLSRISKPKKARGKKGGRKPKNQKEGNQNRIASNLSENTNNQKKITEKSIVDYDNTIETKETLETFNQKSELSEGSTPSSVPPASVETKVSPSSQVRDSFSIKEAIKDLGNHFSGYDSSLPHESSLQPVSSQKSDTVLEAETSELASSDVSTSSESREKPFEEKSFDEQFELLEYYAANRLPREIYREEIMFILSKYPERRAEINKLDDKWRDNLAR
jgi:hypothetical protein